MHSQNSQYPPPPHHPQAHFYGAPQIDLGQSKKASEHQDSEQGYCCRVLDRLPSAGKDVTGHPDDVLLVGVGHGLDVFHLDRKGLDRIGRLSDLRGYVVGAKILPSQPRGGLQASQPLVAVIIHGPYVPSESYPQPEPGQGEDEDFDASKSMLQAMHVADVSHYQTTVEIYSLRTGKHVAHLFQSPKIEVRLGYDNQPLRPAPIGDLRIQTRGKYLVINSGSSGEVFVYENASSDSKDKHLPYKCIGKTWTRTSTTNLGTASIPSNDSDPGSLPEPGVRRTNAAVLALSDRWLAVVPPPSSSYTTLHGQVNIGHVNIKIPGLSSHTPPTEPQATCELDTPKDGSVLNRVARDVAQGALKSAQWVAAEGMQAWNTYWSKSSDHNRSAGSPPSAASTALGPPPQSFPPTHAQDNFNDRAKGQPTVVSIIDLPKLSHNQSAKPSLAFLQPLATFSLPLGCSELSFSPSGLDLLTASAKGDVQHVWDLMRMVHGEPGHVGDPDTAPKAPSIRQVARFSRMTEARIVDVVWTEPRGERFAIITERGTVHINDLPSSAFQWPPYRRRPPSINPPKIESKSENKSSDAVRPQSLGSTFGSAFGMFAGKTQTTLASVRGRSPSANSGFPGFGSLAMTAGVGAKGSKAVAAGINRSVSAAAAGTVSTIRHYGENRLALPTSSNPVSPGCAQWMNGRNSGSIAVTGGGTVRIHSIRRSTDPRAGQRRPSVVADRPVEFSLPKARPPTQYGVHENSRRMEASASPGSYWLSQIPRPTSRRSNLDTHPLSYAEIETNAPYQPFHTDRRVNLFVYDEDATTSDPHHLNNSTLEVFGEAIPATKISAGSTSNSDEVGNAAGTGIMENEIRMEGNVDEGQRIVSTTTWRKKSKKGDGAKAGIDDGEFFEDDCEVLDYAEDRV